MVINSLEEWVEPIGLPMPRKCPHLCCVKIKDQHDNKKNQNDNQMETTAETTMKTIMFSTGSATYETVIQILKEHEIDYTELGKDQKESTVIQLSYKEEQQAIIDDIQLINNFVEDAIALFLPLVTKFLTAFGKEAELGLQKLQDKYAGKKLSTSNKSENNPISKTNGNTKRN